MNELINLAGRAERIVEYWIWNDIVHSWIDPIFLGGVLVALGYAMYRVAKWMIEHD